MREQISRKTVFTLLAMVALLIAAILLLIGPIISANNWKSSTLEANNKAVAAINNASANVEKVQEREKPTTVELEMLLQALRDEQVALNEAKKQADNIGGLKGVDLFNNYSEAEQTQEEVLEVYDELIRINEVYLKVNDRRLQRINALNSFESLKKPQDLKILSSALKNYINKNRDTSGSVNADALLEKDLALLSAFSSSLNSLANAIQAKDINQLEAVAEELNKLQPKLKELDEAYKKEVDTIQQSVNASIEKLNDISRDLE